MPAGRSAAPPPRALSRKTRRDASRRRRTRAPRTAAPESSEPLAALDAEQVRARRLGLQPALQQAWISFLARVLARISCSRRASRRRRIRHRSSGIHTASSSPRHNKLANARASSLSVFARALVIPVSSGLTTTTRFTCGSRIRATSQQLPVTSNATRSDANRLCARVVIPSGVARHPTRRANLAVLADRDHTELAVHVQADRTTNPSRQSHHSPPTRLTVSGRTSGTTTQTDTSSTAQSRQVAGAAERKARARSPSIKTAYPSAFSQESPCPG